MGKVNVTNMRGRSITLDAEAITRLGARLRGELLTPGDPGYDETRRVWNATIDRKPALIARCAGTADVMRSVSFANDHDLLTSVRGGGHNIAGTAVCENGLMIDLSLMTSVRVEPELQRARVEPGVMLGDVDRETQTFGLATPLGVNSTTGAAGLILGGGFGWLSRKHGLTADNLLSADVVTAEGKLVRASVESHADLFWAIRGGGGNFGVATSFELRLHRVGPELLSGLIVFPAEQARDVINDYLRLIETAPDELSVWGILRKAPPLAFLPRKVHGEDVVVLALCHAGEVEQGAELVRTIRGFGKVLGEHIEVQPYVRWQSAFDPLLAPAARNYWKSHNFTELSGQAIDTLLRFAGNMPSPHCEIMLAQLGGQISRTPTDATAYPHRDARLLINVHGRWERARHDKKCMSWTRELSDSMAPFAMDGVYVNFLTADEAERVAAAYGPNHERLVQIKNTYDPRNLFRMNQNIRPTV
jgi:FAD/FMN-containing dehydrogenase